jgi:hypothetical protein
VEFIDEHPVVAHRVRFRNRVDVAEAHGDLVKDDMVVLWLVRTRCEPPQYHPVTKDAEERYRLNIQAVDDALPLAGQLRDQAVAYLEHGGLQGYLDFNVPRFRQEEIFDANDYGPGAADHQLAQLAEYLNDIGEFRDNETPLDAVRRLLDHNAPTEEPPVAFMPETPVPLGLDTGEVEVLGSIYGDHPPASRAIIEEAFGAP